MPSIEQKMELPLIDQSNISHEFLAESGQKENFYKVKNPMDII